ncbi:hypothetical protein Anas_02012 [Armadillidium nasatum]|uniref:Solute carrier family 13 member 5 n=1 Tax=Armadillidium nasatum TaxID=96803 RepID=A0A5N5SZ87_9CRUS|nr:hypothetical protein Anas_02012 [Armadillidium nasatum]
MDAENDPEGLETLPGDPQPNCSDEARCAYVILLMAIYYMTEALPLAVTALMPVFAFPLLGIISTDAICRVYMRGTAMMFFGGLAVAIAVEHCNLHKRIALFVILRVGKELIISIIKIMLIYKYCLINFNVLRTRVIIHFI